MSVLEVLYLWRWLLYCLGTRPNRQPFHRSLGNYLQNGRLPFSYRFLRLRLLDVLLLGLLLFRCLLLCLTLADTLLSVSISRLLPIFLPSILLLMLVLLKILLNLAVGAKPRMVGLQFLLS